MKLKYALVIFMTSIIWHAFDFTSTFVMTKRTIKQLMGNDIKLS